MQLWRSPMFKKLSALAIGVLILTACNSSSTQKQNPTLLLEPGMTKEQVISILGIPSKKQAKNKFEAYRYGRSSWYSVCFDENGKLTDAGETSLIFCRNVN